MDYPKGPVCAIEVYQRDIIVKRQALASCGLAQGGQGKRDKIEYLSQASRRRLAFVACNTDVTFCTMVTLTYPKEYPTDGKTVKKHLAAFIEWMRRNWDNPSYLWFLEFQKRGAPHIHILLSNKRSRGDVALVAQAWDRIVQSRDPKHILAGTRTESIRKKDGAKRYAVKYAFKTVQKRVPPRYQNVGRFWGHSRDVKPKSKGQLEIDEKSLRILLSTWPFLPCEDKDIYKYLFGASQYFPQSIQECMDNPPILE